LQRTDRNFKFTALEGIDRELFDRVEEQNLIRQYDLLMNCIEIGLRQGPTALDKYIEGNGRTARATSYYLLCVRLGSLLPGRRIVPERIRDSRSRYVDALHAADRAWDDGNLDFSEMEGYLADLLEAQLRDVD
jgi:hypothetical protein